MAWKSLWPFKQLRNWRVKQSARQIQRDYLLESGDKVE
jgi:hypothetical protein